MSLPVRSVDHSRAECDAWLFASERVTIGEHRWSPAFASRLSEWAAESPTLVVLDGGLAMASDPRSPHPFAERVRAEWERAHAGAAAVGARREIGSCAVLRFDAPSAPMPVARGSTLALASAPAPPALAGTGSLVQLGPDAVFRLLWRRQALALRYPCHDVHVEDDALALLRCTLARAARRARAPLRGDVERVSRSNALASAARAIMAASIGETHPTASLARRLGVSPFHLAHVFRSEVGVSLHRYLLELRLVAALGRLRAGPCYLSMLALDLGFTHHSHFSARFRRAIGHSPRDVRRMLAAASVADLGILAPPCCRARSARVAAAS